MSHHLLVIVMSELDGRHFFSFFYDSVKEFVVYTQGRPFVVQKVTSHKDVKGLSYFGEFWSAQSFKLSA